MTLSELNRAGPAAQAAPRVQAGDLMERARRVAAIAAEFADDVDRAGRFPAEAIAAVKAEGAKDVYTVLHDYQSAVLLDKIVGDSNTLYRCEANNAVQVVKHCANDCAVHASTDDSCK